MEFEITKEELLRPLQQVSGVVDKKQLQPILAFVLLTFNDNELIVSASDLDIELSAKTEISPQNHIGKMVLPGKKLLDICKSLPDNSKIKLTINKNSNNTEQAVLVANRSRFTLSTLNADEFPLKQDKLNGFSICISQVKLKNLLNNTSFAIAQQDVRHYLMGMLWEFNQHEFRVVATDGHRLATANYIDQKIFPNCPIKVVMPRKSIVELTRLLDDGDSDVTIHISDKSAQLEADNMVFTTKLIDSQFPDYGRVFPSNENSYIVEINKESLKQILGRVSILSNEKHRAVRFCFSENQLVIAANNPEQEQAEELIEILYDFDQLEICFNVSYFLDVLGKITTDNIKIQLKQANTPVLVTPALDVSADDDDGFKDADGLTGDSDLSNNCKLDGVSYIIMPMCL